MVETCTYCESDLAPYDPVIVQETRNGEPIEVGKFCNYGCLTAFVDERGLTEGACCVIDPGEAHD